MILSKKAQSGASKPFGLIITFIILFALLIFALFWYSGLRDNMISVINSFF